MNRARLSWPPACRREGRLDFARAPDKRQIDYIRRYSAIRLRDPRRAIPQPRRHGFVQFPIEVPAANHRHRGILWQARYTQPHFRTARKLDLRIGKSKSDVAR